MKWRQSTFLQFSLQSPNTHCTGSKDNLAPWTILQQTLWHHRNGKLSKNYWSVYFDQTVSVIKENAQHCRLRRAGLSLMLVIMMLGLVHFGTENANVREDILKWRIRSEHENTNIFGAKSIVLCSAYYSAYLHTCILILQWNAKCSAWVGLHLDAGCCLHSTWSR